MKHARTRFSDDCCADCGGPASYSRRGQCLACQERAIKKWERIHPKAPHPSMKV